MISAPLLRIANVDVTHRGEPVPTITGISLDIAPGDFLAVVGESGSGKSTLAHAIVALLPPGAQITRGEILLSGENLVGQREQQLRRVRGRRIGLVPQDPRASLNPVHRVIDQVTDAVRMHRPLSRALARPVAEELLAHAGFPEPRRRGRSYPHELSGGTLQRALIAIALAGEPDLLVADEPTSALDPTVQRGVLDRLQSLAREHNTAVLLVTHDLGVVAERANRVAVMRSGRIVETGTVTEVLHTPREEYTRHLIAAASFRGRTDAPGTSAPSAPELSVPSVQAHEPVVQVTHVGRTFGSARRVHPPAVDDVSFSIAAGETLGLIGESGAGKTTIARMVLGLERPDSGTVNVLGHDLSNTGKRAIRELRRSMQLVYQNPFSSLDPRMTVHQAIAEPLTNFDTRSASEQRSTVAALLDDVALPHSLLHRLPSELSGGQRQRVAIARAIALRPQLIVLDEPVSALDASVQQQVLQILRDLQEHRGLSYLLISHDLDVVRYLAHSALVLRHGKTVEQGPAAEVLWHPRTAYTRELLAAIPSGAG